MPVARFVPVLGLAAILAACGGRPSLEHTLTAGHGKTVCDGSCRSFRATGATCRRETTADGFRLCTVRYDNGGAAERVCAKLVGSRAALRPLRHCS